MDKVNFEAMASNSALYDPTYAKQIYEDKFDKEVDLCFYLCNHFDPHIIA